MKKENKAQLIKELEELGSSLGPPGRDSGFRVPADYFERLPASIQDKGLKTREVSPVWLSWLRPGKLVPLGASLVILLLAGLSILWIRDDSLNGQLAWEKDEASVEYLAMDMDRPFLYEYVMDSDLTAEDILYGLEDGSAFGAVYDDDLLEELFEQSHYLGIDSQYLLSSLD